LLENKLQDRGNIAIVGLGYVGLTLTAVLLEKGCPVFGIDTNQKLVAQLSEGVVPIEEPGLQAIIEKHAGKDLILSTSYPKDLIFDVLVIAVSTPINAHDLQPDLRALNQAIDNISGNLNNDSLVIVRSTVPVGTTDHIRSKLNKELDLDIKTAFCPERTIQGRALEEITELPQIVGGTDEPSLINAHRFFEDLGIKTVKVSNSKTAEFVKLVNNCHTDLIYSYGNQVAIMAKKLGINPWETINAANQDYPRPNLSSPGYVGGSCLSKDPYILLSSLPDVSDNKFSLVKSARLLNESMPKRCAKEFVQLLLKIKNGNIQNTKVLICGFAYKGIPETDDTRGTPCKDIIEELSQYNLNLYGQDFVVDYDVINSFQVKPVNLEDGFDNADGIIILNNHPNYAKLPIKTLVSKMNSNSIIYDSWLVLDNYYQAGFFEKITYTGICLG